MDSKCKSFGGSNFSLSNTVHTKVLRALMYYSRAQLIPLSAQQRPKSEKLRARAHFDVQGVARRRSLDLGLETPKFSVIVCKMESSARMSSVPQ